jgi:hypothetical protein
MLAPIINELGKLWQFEPGLNYPRTDGQVIFVPDSVRARQPEVNIAIAHDLYQSLFGIPGNATDVAYDAREVEFDDWARSVVIPQHWFRKDANQFGCDDSVRKLAERYNVHPQTIITRALELGLCAEICRDQKSYELFTAHKYWKERRAAYLTAHSQCALCETRAVMVAHSFPVGYGFIGREDDEHLLGYCKPHWDAQLSPSAEST